MCVTSDLQSNICCFGRSPLRYTSVKLNCRQVTKDNSFYFKCQCERTYTHTHSRTLFCVSLFLYTHRSALFCAFPSCLPIYICRSMHFHLGCVATTELNFNMPRIFLAGACAHTHTKAYRTQRARIKKRPIYMRRFNFVSHSRESLEMGSVIFYFIFSIVFFFGSIRRASLLLESIVWVCVCASWHCHSLNQRHTNTLGVCDALTNRT